MNAKEYIRLAKLSINERRKSTKTTIRGLFVGFIILIPMFVVLFGINISIANQLNRELYLLYYEATMSDYRIETEDYYDKDSNMHHISGSAHIDAILNNPYISNAIIYEKYLMGKSRVDTVDFRYSIDDSDYIPLTNMQDKVYSIIDVDKSNIYFPDNLANNYDGGIFLDGFGQGFTDKGKRQVIVSESFINDLGLNIQDVYLKPLTVIGNTDINLPDSTSVNIDAYLCNNYTVVGVIKSDVTNLYDKNDYMSSSLFFTSVNLYHEQGAPLKPFLQIASNGYAMMRYESMEDINIFNDEYMMVGWHIHLLSNAFSQNIFTAVSTDIYMESSSYDDFAKAIKRTNNHYISIFGYEINALRVPDVYRKFEQLYEIANLVSFIFVLIGTVLALCSIINLYSSIKHNVKGKRLYLTMMRAMGVRDNVIPKLYLTESFIIMNRANIRIISVGFVISLSLKLLIEMVLRYNQIIYFSIPWLSIFISIGVVAISLYIIGAIFAYVCTYKLSKQSIVSVLGDY